MFIQERIFTCTFDKQSRNFAILNNIALEYLHVIARNFRFDRWDNTCDNGGSQVIPQRFVVTILPAFAASASANSFVRCMSPFLL